MSDKKNIADKFKELASAIFGDDKAEKVEAKFMDAKLDDGSIIRYDADEIVVGVQVFIVGEDGSVLPLPAGSYTLEDGSTFDVIDENGTADNVIMAVVDDNTNETESEMEGKTPVTEKAKEAKSITETQTVTKQTEFKEEVKEEVKKPVMVDESFASVKLEFAKDVADLKAKLEAQEDTIKKMFSLIEELGNQEEVKTPETKTNVFKKEKRMTITKEQVREAKQNFRDQLSGKK